MGSANQPPQQKASNFGSLLGLGTWWFCLVFGILSYGCSLICVLFWVLGFEKGGIFCLGCGGWTVLGGWTTLSCLEEEWVMEMEMKMVKEVGFHSSSCGFLSSFGEGFKWESTWRVFIGWRKTSVLRHSLIECFLYYFIFDSYCLRVVNWPSRASPTHFYLAHGHNGLGIMDY